MHTDGQTIGIVFRLPSPYHLFLHRSPHSFLSFLRELSDGWIEDFCFQTYDLCFDFAFWLLTRG